MGAARIDHVLYGVRDLERSAARFEAEYGFTAAGGGSHGELGTANRLIPLGDQYLELITVADPVSQHPLAVVLGARIADGDCLFSLAIEVDDIDAAADRLGSTVLDGTRTGPANSSVHFRLAGFEAALAEQVPFFIEWGVGREHRLPTPGVEANPNAHGVAWVELGGDVERVRAWLGEDVEGIRLVGGEPGIRSLAVTTVGREIVVR